MRIRSLNHSHYQHQYHIVWGTRYRRKFLKEYIKPAPISSINKTLKKYPTLFIEAINTDQDHVHIQIEVPPSISVSSAVQVIKQRTSIDLRKKFEFIREMYLEDGMWSVGYFSSTIGLNEAAIHKYIEYKGRRELSEPSDIEFS